MGAMTQLTQTDRFEDRRDEIAALFADAFTASEGPDEGRAIGRLARALMDTTPRADLRVFTTDTDGCPVAAVIFTRLHAGGDARRMMLLSPMAVEPDRQGAGIGTRLIAHALDALRSDAVAVAVTYGDPAFYGRTGFTPVTENVLPAPQPLSQPEGWLAQSLTDAPLTPVTGPTRCAPALDDPAFW
jgi:predicted N-acetyltransferase YhbS